MNTQPLKTTWTGVGPFGPLCREVNRIARMLNNLQIITGGTVDISAEYIKLYCDGGAGVVDHPFKATASGGNVTIAAGLLTWYGKMSAPISLSGTVPISGGTSTTPNWIILRVTKGATVASAQCEFIENSTGANPNSPTHLEVPICTVYRSDALAIVGTQHQFGNILIGAML